MLHGKAYVCTTKVSALLTFTENFAPQANQ